MITFISTLVSFYLIYRIIFVDKEDKRSYKGWWEYDPNKFDHKNEKGK